MKKSTVNCKFNKVILSVQQLFGGDSELLNIIGNKSNHHTYNTSNDLIVSDYKFKFQIH